MSPLLTSAEAGGDKGILHDVAHGKSVMVYANDITIIVPEVKPLQRIDESIKKYKTIARARINHERSVGLHLCTWRGKSIRLNNVVRCWMEGLVKMPGVWLGQDLQIEKNWSKVTSKVSVLTQTWSEWWLSLEGKVEVLSVYIAFIISYCLTIMLCPD